MSETITEVRFQAAKSWLDKHGSERRSNLSDGYQLIVEAHGAGPRGIVRDENSKTEHREAFEPPSNSLTRHPEVPDACLIESKKLRAVFPRGLVGALEA